jgi:hypothetical protein
MHPFDRFFYDKETGNYTVDKFLDDLRTRYGGIDAALVWPHYPNIGADNRNQFDLFRALPGGISGVTGFTQELQSAGVKVLWPYIEWDVNTRREADWQPAGTDNAVADAKTMVGLLKQTGGAGINGDSIPFVPEAFWNASVDAGEIHPH